MLAGACGAGNGSPGALPTNDVTTTAPAPSTTTTLPVDITAAPEKPTLTTTTLPPPDASLPPGFDPRGIDQVEFAIEDLVATLGVDESAIDVVVVEEVVWRDGSIGCPQPGMAYTQALVDGMRIVLAHDGTRYEYHGGGGRDPFYCVNPAE